MITEDPVGRYVVVGVGVGWGDDDRVLIRNITGMFTSRTLNLANVFFSNVLSLCHFKKNLLKKILRCSLKELGYSRN